MAEPAPPTPGRRATQLGRDAPVPAPGGRDHKRNLDHLGGVSRPQAPDAGRRSRTANANQPSPVGLTRNIGSVCRRTNVPAWSWPPKGNVLAGGGPSVHVRLRLPVDPNVQGPHECADFAYEWARHPGDCRSGLVLAPPADCLGQVRPGGVLGSRGRGVGRSDAYACIGGSGGPVLPAQAHDPAELAGVGGDDGQPAP
jgi:hypothetical protein